MDLKKSPKADLEGKRTIFLELGLIAALVVVYLMFNWSQNPDKVEEIQYAMDNELEEEVLITRNETPPPPPPPPPPKKPVVADVIEVTEEKLEVDEEIQIDAEADEEEVIEVTEIEQDEEIIDEQEIFTIVEEGAEFPGGQAALLKYLSKHIRYPQIAIDNGVQGRVYLRFVVEKDGSIGDVQLTRGVDKSLDKEAIRVVKTLPKFKPGKQRGRAVRQWFQVPVTFRLE